MNKIKIAIVVSHPIQHFCPQYVSFAKHEIVQIKVFFGSALGYKKYTDSNFKREIAWDNLQLENFDHVFLNGDLVLQPDKNLDALTLETELTNYAPNVLIGYGYFQKFQRRARKWAIDHKITYGYISDAEARQHRYGLKQYVRAFMLYRYFSKIDLFLTVGDANEAYYLRYKVPPAKMVRMHFPIDVEQYASSFENRIELSDRVRSIYKIGADEIVISVVGKLASWKNQGHIIDALVLLEKKGIRIHLFILGSGEMEEAWKKKGNSLSESKVYFPGFVDIKDLPAYYAATDIYVHPAEIEPHSIAISEAIYMGCPVILSDRCGSYGETDDVKEGENGIVFPFGDIEALANAIESLAKNKILRECFAEASHQRAVRFQEMAHFRIIEKILNHEDSKSQRSTKKDFFF